MDAPCFYRISVKGLSIDETGRFLLMRESDGRWDLPGGGLEHEEDPIDALKRELREETGIEITAVSPSPHYFVAVARGVGATYMANIVYQITLKDHNFTPSAECEELRYCSIEEAKQLNLLPNVAKFLDVYNPQNHLG